MFKFLLQTVLCTLIVIMAGAQAREQPFNTLFKAEKKWLALPVKDGAPKRRVDIWLDGQLLRYIDIELAEDRADWFSYLDISQWKGQELDLRVNLLRTGSNTLSPVLQSDADTNSNAGALYQEKYRGRFHFSPKRGWMNDPNGLVYYNGEYHLFFQHNPYGSEWGNMHWGHAVSRDLLHWKEVGEALYPAEYGTIFSGSAIVDSNNTSGLGKDGKAPLVAFFTCDRSWTQGMAWTTDGRHFEQPRQTVVPRFSMGNRDPKVIWHAPSGKWVMVFWAETTTEPRQHTIRFYTSPNLKDWTYVSSVTGGAGNYLFECPEFYELPLEGDATQKKWVLTAANGMYAIGRFDGTVFTPEAERLQGQHGRDFYASQTFNNEPKGRRIEIGWWRTKTNIEGMSFNQSQSIPLEIRLVNTADGPRIARFPVKELESLRTQQHELGKRTLTANAPYDLSRLNLQEFEMRLSLEPGKAKQIELSIHGRSISYDTEKQQLSCDGVTASAPLVKGKLHLVIFADRVGFEILTADGLLFMPVNVNLDMDNKKVAVTATGGKAAIDQMVIYELGSIWQ